MGIEVGVHGVICRPRVYKYKGWLFEFHATGVWPLNNDGMPKKRAGRVFFSVASEFGELPKEERELHRVGGGCTFF
jgi:hypothetical protein